MTIADRGLRISDLKRPGGRFGLRNSVSTVPLAAAVRRFAGKGPVAEALSNAEWEGVPLALRERAFWTANFAGVDVLGMMHEEIGKGLALAETGGRLANRGTFITDMRERLRASGYVAPEGKAGTIQDLMSAGRLGLIHDMNTEGAQEFARWKAGQDEGALLMYPAQELYREVGRTMPRDWVTRWREAAEAVGQEGVAQGRIFVALKSSPIWMRLSRFGTPWPPFDFRSGMGLRDVGRAEAVRLGLITRKEKPKRSDAGFNDSLQGSVKGLAPELRNALETVFPGRIEMTGDVVKWSGQFHDPFVATDFTELHGDLKTAARSAMTAAADVLDVPATRLLGVGEHPAPDGRLGEYTPGYARIEIRPSAPNAAMTMLHEHGHYVDEALGGLQGKYASETAVTKDVWPVLRTMMDSQAVSALGKVAAGNGPLKGWAAKAILPEEQFARAYAQYVSLRSGRDDLREELAAMLGQTMGWGHWTEKDFAPIAAALDALFALRGWTR